MQRQYLKKTFLTISEHYIAHKLLYRMYLDKFHSKNGKTILLCAIKIIYYIRLLIFVISQKEKNHKLLILPNSFTFRTHIPDSAEQQHRGNSKSSNILGFLMKFNQLILSWLFSKNGTALGLLERCCQHAFGSLSTL